MTENRIFLIRFYIAIEKDVFYNVENCFSVGDWVKSDQDVRDLKQYLDKNYRKQVKIGELCAQRYTSEQYVCRRFKEVVGISPKQYLMDLRLRKAAEKLRSSQGPVYQVAASCGFTDMNNFSKQFRAAYGCTPGQYREQK